MNAFRTRPMTYPWPPMLFGLSAATALLLDMRMPLPLADDGGLPARLAGFCLIGVAILIDLWAIKTLMERKTAVLPHHCTRHLVTCGPFGLTRNPIYLGYTGLLAGIGLIEANVWCFVVAIIFVAVTSHYAIRQEEQHLLSRFGIDYERYARATTRWI
ncbi:Protein-S-isoprenylcysteine O-methyltransferase Ste14 [Rhizobium sp. RU20A]|uniref:methyltransferase family protein n=1 Tax=Rhizobium sp. RU20A TaxID=1907412 RepID=UPI0009556AFD|nr:isoprenylcysteine carboxylmethyltransferase family protein [Rhizobium sp. RU20A]SIQ12898.1 Protein-S-isoprenylcysteine O-methyltransferase Ste14 [Rhizobium sp. RU20A]